MRAASGRWCSESARSQTPRQLSALLSHFRRLVKLDRARHTADVESADAAASGLAGQRPGRSGARVRPGLSASFAQNPALIGGMRIKVGSDVYDGSVQAGLAALERSF